VIVRRRSRAAGNELHGRFRPRPGSDYVASGFALAAIIELVERRRPASVLEVGAGIGTLTTAVVEASARAGRVGSHVAVEEIDFCLEQLQANLGAQLDGVDVVPRAAEAPEGLAPYDLVIIDGGATTDLLPADQHRWTAADERGEVAAWMAHLAPGALVLVENERAPQRAHVEAEATRPYAHEHVRPFDAGPGYHLYHFDPSPTTRLGVRAREALRALWFPRGIRLLRRAHVRVLRRPVPERRAVAPGDQAGPA